ncbi:hypothetical protein HMPREF9123_0984 [Neisseria bacilliformis ATCC BAA-1200]|jgi:hypothetical protein|uniref:Uncharacterized protein n=1 Tax=Neisseria bacilliformis ATCC BAA-1200 TaxID=888742 RepID=F2BB80_9NEIS|nr:hypothetical protein HMPREF9123_0984 [Neisseria bacilliformis ATCC BAA-1200]
MSIKDTDTPCKFYFTEAGGNFARQNLHAAKGDKNVMETRKSVPKSCFAQ